MSQEMGSLSKSQEKERSVYISHFKTLSALSGVLLSPPIPWRQSESTRGFKHWMGKSARLVSSAPEGMLCSPAPCSCGEGSGGGGEEEGSIISPWTKRGSGSLKP